MLKSGLWFFVSNDVNTSLWHDIWVGSLYPSASYPDLQQSWQSGRALFRNGSLWRRALWVWEIQLEGNLLLDTSAVHLCDNLRVKCIWIHDVKVGYAVRSCSSLVYHVTLGENSPIQSFVWKSIAPPKVLFGLLPWGKCRQTIFSANWNCRPSCQHVSFCYSTCEAANHLLLQKRVWLV